MSNSTKLIIWGLVNFIFFTLYSFRSKQSLNLTAAINIALASGGLVTSISLFYQLVASQTLKEILEKEVGFDITALYLGVIAAGWVSLQPIAQLFEVNSFAGKVDGYHIDTGTTIYLNLYCNKSRIYRVVLTEEILQAKLKNLPNTQTFPKPQNPQDLIGRNISILEVVPIQSGKVQELRITQPEQLIIS
ncbi:hypothetical protein [Nostoc sp. DSM 114167]|jgi:hypothetical protein|uniref:hypothetical protein n=1 Tax=Nostoc sp. DSM 114167 TaxID=3439050 RepID=UPI00404630BD